MKVSIIIPIHNERSSIKSILDNVAGYVAPEIIEEVIVVNDHSTDETARVVKECAQKYSAVNIKVILNDTPAGFANALRRGMKEARRDLIIYLMADGCDRVSPLISYNTYNDINAGYPNPLESERFRGHSPGNFSLRNSTG